jgi:allantoinase
MEPIDLVVRGRRVILPGAPDAAPASIHVQHGVIAAITPSDEAPAGVPVFDAGDWVVMPGIVDPHVHINEPGRADWEGFSTATRAAAAGGVTTLIEMPLNSVPATTSAEAFRAKLAATAGKLHVDAGFWGGVIPGNTAELRPLWEAGVFGFKCFLVPSGVDEFPHVTEKDLRAAMPVLAELGAPLLVHAELPGPIERIEKAAPGSKGAATRYATWLASRPPEAETEAIALVLQLSREFNVHVHVVHLSAAAAVPLLAEAREKGTKFSVETCPHYLTFAAEDIPDAATEFKCAPPIRDKDNREKLWAALGDGLIEFVATDHSPCPPELKCRESGDFLKAWGGIASLQLELPAVWTLAQQRGHSVQQVVEWLCGRPAKLAGLGGQKGTIAVGCDADFVVWNPEGKFRVQPSELYQRHKLTPYAGMEMRGVVEATFLRARKIFERPVISKDAPVAATEFSTAPIGHVLKRGSR